MQTKRIKPDYFIEIYGTIGINELNYYSTGCNSIDFLKQYLKKTKEVGFETIAIFKIKLK